MVSHQTNNTNQSDKQRSHSYSSNLPVPLSTFIGREHEIVKVKRLILANRLVTLAGAGGSGKTRLALKVAQELTGKFRGGIWFVDLASLRDSNFIPQKISSSLDIRERPGRSPLDTLTSYLLERELLLILDNCEHLIEACVEITDLLLQKCPALHILATSREVMGITGEVAWTVLPLTLPDPQPWRNPDSAQQALPKYEASESVQLFIDRVRTNDPEFDLTIKNGAWVAEICRRLDGMPLAIELAAAQVRSLTVQEIARRLDNRFQLLTSGSRTAPPRQQTLASTLDWSYELLSSKEQMVLQRLSVFAGGSTIQAAERVCAGGEIESANVLELLTRLVDKNLVTADRLERGETRYRLLETIREYAMGKLAESQENAEVQNTHLEFFLQFAEEADWKIKGPEEIEWYTRLEDEHDNMRAALSWALESKNAEVGLRLTNGLVFFWFVHGHVMEGIGWLEKSLAQKQGASMASEAKALTYLGTLLLNSEKKNFDKCALLHEKSLNLFRQLGDRSGIAWVLNQLGIVVLNQDELVKAKQLINESLALRRELGDPWSIAQTLQNLIPFALQENDYVKAKEYTEETIAWFEQAGDQRGVARTLRDLAELARLQGDFGSATEILTQSLSKLLELGDKWSVASVLESLAILASEQGHSEQAARLFGASEALRNLIGMPLQDLDSEDLQKYILRIRKDLGEKKIAQAWAQGGAVPFEEILAFVTQEPESASTLQTEKERFGGLTAREREAAVLIAEGLSNREVAEAMTVTVKTVEAYVTRIRRKLGFDSRVQIATWVIERGLR